MEVQKTPLLAIFGPTATGKTGLAIQLAKALDGEIICADSMQIYKYLNIGTAKPTQQERAQALHHLVDFLEPEEQYSVAAYQAAANTAIADVIGRGKLPILCGGTGQYITAVVEGLQFSPMGRQQKDICEHFTKNIQEANTEQLLQQLEKVDPQKAAKLQPADRKRILRALEIHRSTGESATAHEARSIPAERPYKTLLLSLDYVDRQQLYAGIEARVDAMMAQGLLQEAKRVFDNKDRFPTAVQAIGYKEFFPHFTEGAPLEICVTNLKQATRRYAKRQRTWFRRYGEEALPVWVGQTFFENVLQQASTFVAENGKR